MKESEEKEERLMLLESWREFEVEHGDAQSLQDVDKLMPNKVKKRRKIQTDDGVSHPYPFFIAWFLSKYWRVLIGSSRDVGMF